MKKVCIWLLVLLVSTASLEAQMAYKKTKTNKKTDSSGIIMPEEDHIKVQLLVSQLLNKYHYRKNKLNDSLSNVIFENYLGTLDNNKMYFTQSDLDRFEEYRYSFDDDIRSGNLVPAYHIFNVYRKNLKSRLDYLPEILEKEFDFEVEETFEVDREDAAWPKDQDELNVLWTKMIKNQALNLKLADREWKDVKKTIEGRFDRVGSTVEQYNSEDVLQIYLNAFGQAFDPHTNYLNPTASANFKIDMSQSLEGIGAQLQLDNEYTKVSDVIVGGPAYKTKMLEKGDRIIGVAQEDENELVDVVGWRLDEVVKLIRGPKGTRVTLQILPAAGGESAAPKDITIERDKVKLEEQSAKKQVIEFEEDGKSLKFGVISIPIFYQDFEAAQAGDKDFKSTTRDTRRLIEELKEENIDGLVIDLRYNGGGSLTEAIELSGLFIENGPVVQVRNANGSIDVGDDPDPEIAYDGPLAVMVNRFSASASEIFSGAMQDYKRGIIIGEQTYGKGTVQNLIDLDRFVADDGGNLGELKLTLAKFYRITGSSTQHKGVEPDIAFPSAYSAEQFGESSEKSALPWDQIRSVEFEATNDLNEEMLSQLNKSHEERMKTNENLINLLEDIEELKALQNQKEVSLVESVRREERDRLEEKRASRREVIKEQNSADDEDFKEKIKIKDIDDPYLEESIYILIDLASGKIG